MRLGSDVWTHNSKINVNSKESINLRTWNFLIAFSRDLIRKGFPENDDDICIFENQYGNLIYFLFIFCCCHSIWAVLVNIFFFFRKIYFRWKRNWSKVGISATLNSFYNYSSFFCMGVGTENLTLLRATKSDTAQNSSRWMLKVIKLNHIHMRLLSHTHFPIEPFSALVLRWAAVASVAIMCNKKFYRAQHSTRPMWNF